MQHTYQVTGMTCDGCKKTVTEKLTEINGVSQVAVNREAGTAMISMEQPIALETLQKALPKKYTLSEKKTENIFENTASEAKKSKLQQLKPLFLIFGYLFMAAILLHYKNWNTGEAMLDFMGLFYIVFSFFKFLDMKGFPESFRMYDPLAKVLPVYGWIYPFMELGLGLLFLMRVEITLALWVTLVILGITTIGVVQTLLGKRTLQCACLGTALQLPMTEATFIENALMIVMALVMLLNLV